MAKQSAAVKIAKKLFKRSRNPYLALLEWRNTPTIGMQASPSQHLLARRTRGIMPTSRAKLECEPQDGMSGKKIKRQGQIQAQQEGKGQSLAPLKKGEPVLVQDMQARKKKWMRGHYLEPLTDRSGIVEVDGRLLHRSRQFLKPTPNAPQVPWEEVCQAPASEQLSSGESRSVPPKAAATSSNAQSQGSPIVHEAELEKEIPKGNTVTSAVQQEEAVQTRSTASVLPASHGVTTTTRCGRLVRKLARYQDFIEH